MRYAENVRNILNQAVNFAREKKHEYVTPEHLLFVMTFDDDFADDCVLVVLTQEESIKFKEYTPTDFSEIGCKNIKGLATTKFNKGKNAVESIACAVNSNKEPISL